MQMHVQSPLEHLLNQRTLYTPVYTLKETFNNFTRVRIINAEPQLLLRANSVAPPKHAAHDQESEAVHVFYLNIGDAVAQFAET